MSSPSDNKCLEGVTKGFFAQYSKPDTEKPRFASKRGFIQEAINGGEREYISNLPPQRQGSYGIYGIKLRCGEKGEVIRVK